VPREIPSGLRNLPAACQSYIPQTQAERNASPIQAESGPLHRPNSLRSTVPQDLSENQDERPLDYFWIETISNDSAIFRFSSDNTAGEVQVTLGNERIGPVDKRMRHSIEMSLLSGQISHRILSGVESLPLCAEQEFLTHPILRHSDFLWQCICADPGPLDGQAAHSNRHGPDVVTEAGVLLESQVESGNAG
jgi:hypothetical protein